MKVVVPYGIRFGVDGKIEVMPVVEARVKLKEDSPPILAIFLIDSGATTTLLPSTDAEALGFALESGKKVLVGGVTRHRLVGYRHHIMMEIQGNPLDRVSVIFAKDRNAPRILGREDIFSRFGILFDEGKRRIAFLDSHTERRTIDRLFSE